ncbi:glyoxalase superfamily protein [Nocardiopsis alba]|uniref:Glyoxalase-like domain protein n=1 Tax=Nocardiopsis alba (strain ATCC BAA-2165 / BE74) TaxID=1205910 RepID=J7LFU3_NOCAA|nr:glyoxalase superfamily protein [Nocardiopsis alba]AFR09739.1 glyoxalase-like domain protein [Nocardiopsis alba ATCC BAA-2165]
MTEHVDEVERAARLLQEDLGRSGTHIIHERALETAARMLGHHDRDTDTALDVPSKPWMRGAVPILRIHDEEAAREFYVDHLGCSIEWEHRFAPGMPLYARLRRDELVIDLSGHEGDGTPGSVLWVEVGDVHRLHEELSRSPHPRTPPEIDLEAPGGPTMTIVDPFTNVIRFCRPEE